MQAEPYNQITIMFHMYYLFWFYLLIFFKEIPSANESSNKNLLLSHSRRDLGKSSRNPTLPCRASKNKKLL